jgi:hypothetical protein
VVCAEGSEAFDGFPFAFVVSGRVGIDNARVISEQAARVAAFR